MILFVSFIATSIINAVTNVSANTVSSSTIYFQGSLTDHGGGRYTGILPCLATGGGFDIYGKEGDTAWFGDDPGGGPVWTSQAIGADHDAWPTWTPDTPDWYQYSLNLYFDGSQYKWALRNHPGATATNPWYDTIPGWPKPPKGVPMSGSMLWYSDGSGGYAEETDVGAYLPATGTPEIPGGAAGYGGGVHAWDMDWSWGSEVVPLEYPGFELSITPLGGGTYDVIMTPAPPRPVGGLWTPINKFELLAPWIGLAAMTTEAAVSIGYVKRRKKKQP